MKLPLSAVVIATLLTTHAGSSVEPLFIVGAVVSYVATLALSRATVRTSEVAASLTPQSAPAATAIPASAPAS